MKIEWHVWNIHNDWQPLNATTEDAASTPLEHKKRLILERGYFRELGRRQDEAAKAEVIRLRKRLKELEGSY